MFFKLNSVYHILYEVYITVNVHMFPCTTEKKRENPTSRKITNGSLMAGFCFFLYAIRDVRIRQTVREC